MQTRWTAYTRLQIYCLADMPRISPTVRFFFRRQTTGADTLYPRSLTFPMGVGVGGKGDSDDSGLLARVRVTEMLSEPFISISSAIHTQLQGSL